MHETKLPLEIPMCVSPLGFPIIGTSLHILRGAGFKAMFPMLRRAHPDLLNLEFHAIDFVDDTDLNDPELVRVQPDLSIPWQKKRETYLDVFRTIRSAYSFATLREAAGV